jgi:acyl-CoA thioester hydrolase
MKPSLPFDPAVCLTHYVVRVRFRDTDLMGIVHHATYLEYLEAGRIEYLRRRGVDYGAWAARGVHLAVAEVRIRYRRPARFDERISIETRLAELGRASARFEYRLVREVGSELIAEAATVLACIDDGHAVRRVPEELSAVLRSAETHPRDADRA